MEFLLGTGLLFAIASVYCDPNFPAQKSTGLLHKQSAAPQVGPIGVNKEVEYQCTFFSNGFYTCKKDCDSADELTSVPFRDRTNLKYMDRNCSTKVPIRDPLSTSKEYTFLNGRVNFTTLSQIVATCSFFKTFWYECYGVADCSRGEGITTCAGAAPWRGYYKGTPEDGTVEGNITAEAQYSPPMVFSPEKPVFTGNVKPVPIQHHSANAPQVPAPARRVQKICEKFFNSSVSCYELVETCSGSKSCTRVRQHLARNSTTELYHSKVDKVALDAMQGSLSVDSDIVVECYFYNKTDTVCGFPFFVHFSGRYPPETFGRYFKVN